MHWANKYIGKPWSPGATGPDAYDCWGLLCVIYKDQFGVELPHHIALDKTDRRGVIKFVDSEVRNATEWRRVTSPVDGCAVAMGSANKYSHVGVYLEIDGGLILHSAERTGVIAQSISALRASGLGNLIFFKHGPNC
jgi:cell wall-associated NlpC family hydrolase